MGGIVFLLRDIDVYVYMILVGKVEMRMLRVSKRFFRLVDRVLREFKSYIRLYCLLVLLFCC